MASSRRAEGAICAGGEASPAGGCLELVAGEETRSRETRESAEMTARHLVPFRAALRAGDPRGTGCGDDGEFHWPLPLGLSIPHRRYASLMQSLCS